MAIPIGGFVSVDRKKEITFRLHRPRKNGHKTS
jgi:hypothetical protein